MISYGEFLQKPGVEVFICQLVLPTLPTINEYVLNELSEGRGRELTSYGVDGAVVNHEKRHGYSLFPTGTGSIGDLVDIEVGKYWKKNFRQIDGMSPILITNEILSYPVGAGIIVHADDQVLRDGVRVGFDPHRAISTILFLNDDYEGGNLDFPGRITIQPKAGKLVIFPGNKLFPHGVTPITKGQRQVLQRVYCLADEHGSFVPGEPSFNFQRMMQTSPPPQCCP